VIYQLYPRSFYDTNQDGIGDIPGIIEKLDYLKGLGIGAIWLNPVYASPNDDMGYDISDYEQIMKEFGTMDDFKKMLEEAHKREIRIIMDLVVNHSSDEHQWFIESRKSKDNPYRDYYIWREGKQKKEPNNWASFFTPSAWKFDESTGEYYLHLFSEKQPDLNWENEKVREEIFRMINNWLDLGVDGFRMDVINLVAKYPGLLDGTGDKTPSGYVFSPEYFANQPMTFTYLSELYKRCFIGRDCMCVGETPFTDTETAKKFLKKEDPMLDMIFQFELMDIDSGKSGKWEIVPYTMKDFKEVVARWQEATKDSWNSLFWSNHDQPRPLSRFVTWSTQEERVLAGKMLAVAMHLQRGTSFLYQGEEIGMINATFDSVDQLMDIESIQYYQERKKVGREEEAWNAIARKGRDHARTPMQWNAEKNAGFTKGTPWLLVNESYPLINVEQAMKDPDSLYYFYKQLIQCKTTSDTLLYGDFTLLHAMDDNIFGYARRLNKDEIQILCNFTASPVPLVYDVPEESKVILSNYKEHFKDILQPFETIVVQSKAPM